MRMNRVLLFHAPFKVGITIIQHQGFITIIQHIIGRDEEIEDRTTYHGRGHFLVVESMDDDLDD